MKTLNAKRLIGTLAIVGASLLTANTANRVGRRLLGNGLRGGNMIGKHKFREYARFLAGAGVLLFAATAQAQYSQPGTVSAIEQGRAAFFGGNTFVKLRGVTCAARSDGYFVLPNDTKQAQQLQMLLTLYTTGRRAVINYDPNNCIAASVSICPPGSGPC